MKKMILATAALALAMSAPLAAQGAHLGLSLNLSVPTGGFSSTDYGAYKESYDPTVGLQFTASFPVDRSLAFRLDVGGATFSGKGDEPGYARFNLQDAMFSIGGSAQVFLGDGNALRHTGTYLLGGLALDMERFTGSYDDPAFFADTTLNKSRMAVLAGFGHSFRYAGRMRWNFEAAYHKTLTSHDAMAGDPPPADFLRLSWGLVF